MPVYPFEICLLHWFCSLLIKHEAIFMFEAPTWKMQAGAKCGDLSCACHCVKWAVPWSIVTSPFCHVIVHTTSFCLFFVVNSSDISVTNCVW